MRKSQTCTATLVFVDELLRLFLESQVWIRGRVHQVRGKGGSAFLVVRQDAVSTVQAVHFKNKENPQESKRCVRG